MLYIHLKAILKGHVFTILVTSLLLTLCLQVSSADNIGKQFGPRSGPTNCQALSGSNLFDILMVFLKEFFQKVYFEKKKSADDKIA